MTWDLAASGGLAAAVISAQIAGHAAAGAASDSSGWVLIAVAAAAWAGWWCWHAWRHPYRPCWRCDGTGRNNGSTRKRYGTCRTCKGTGRQIRLGARLFHRTLTRGRR